MVKPELANSDRQAWVSQVQAELQSLSEENDKFKAVLAVYRADFDVYQASRNAEHAGFWGRTLIRSMFAGIEGLVYRAKQVALAAARLKNVSFSDAELALLREESYTLTDKGEAQIQKGKLRTAANIAFSLRMDARGRGGTYEVDVNSAGWQALKSSLRVRDRLTHPKGAVDLEVSELEISAAMTASMWYLTEQTRIIESFPILNARAAPQAPRAG